MGREAKACSIKGCGNPYHCRGYCQPHYDKLKRAGVLKPTRKRYYSPAEALAARSKPAEGGCLEWTGYCNPKGYGVLKFKGSARLAHCVAWELENGEVPSGLEVDHTCHNPACVKLSHLRLATRSQNTQNRSGAVAGSASRFRGVTWDKRRGRWIARAADKYFGSYDNEEEAALAAARARKELFGEYAGRD